jgi:signal transduction histidine kinase/CheY-like chemotaxis protein
MPKNLRLRGEPAAIPGPERRSKPDRAFESRSVSFSYVLAGECMSSDRIPLSSIGPATGEMAAFVRSHDWSKGLLGPIESWSPNLRLTVDLMLASGFPMAVRWGPDFVLIYNDGYKHILGDKHPSALGLPFREVWPEVQERLAPMHEAILAGEHSGLFSVDLPLNIRRHGARWEEARFTISYSAIPDPTAAKGVGGVLITAVETTERVLMESALEHLNATLEQQVIERTEQLRKQEEQLRQSQKMEALGQLTGGVAHDFNNLLQVISGNLQLLAKDVAGNARAERRVANANLAISRGARLASQLLAFGRRQALQPKAVNIGRLVSGMDEMLRRALGEAVEIEVISSGGLWNTLIDPTQVENAVLNLAINARDAMEGTGKLTIEVGNASLDDAYARSNADVTPGQYVVLAVTDTGSGIAPEVMAQVFEPFFSTKPEGKGTGLGLSMVYGFVKQSGGHVKIYSEVGHGTTIKLYLPRIRQSEDVVAAIEDGPATGGTEIILVVEDDDEVRVTVVEMLSDLGYRVLKANDAASALAVIESGIPIDLLFTDVVMPGTLKSPELARKASERLPDIAVLFTSGYTENAIVHGGRLDAGVELLPKPYTRETLARKIRHVLANRAQHRRAATQRTVRPQISPLGLNVLLVEDDNLIRSCTAQLLQDVGNVVIEAGSAEEAIALLRTKAVDVIITDLGLPGMSGAEFAAQAREMRPTIGIVFATGAGEPPVLGGGGASAVILRKPYDSADIAAALKAVRSPIGDEASLCF